MISTTMRSYRRRSPQHQNFARHFSMRAIRRLMRLIHGAGRPVILVGHSWGAVTAIKAAQWAKRRSLPLALLVTVDPVGRPRLPVRSAAAYQGLAGEWIAVVGTRDRITMTPGNLVAKVWARTPLAILRHADRLHWDHKATHENFAQMLRSCGAEARIAALLARA